MTPLSSLLDRARQGRMPHWAGWAAEGTDCVRWFHGAIEGSPGLTVDQYGPLALVQSFRAPLAADELADIRAWVQSWPQPPAHLVWNHRGKEPMQEADPDPAALAPVWARELGLAFRIQARHRGRDPWLFLDFRAGRRWLRAHAAGASVLNLFSYTCGAGVAAAAGGAKQVWNIDFAASALAVGAHNAQQNGCAGPDFRCIKADALPTLRQLSGLGVKGRGARRPYVRFEARRFDLVVLDPPTFARTPFGAVDLVRDYAALFKPAVLCLGAGGRILATNHVSTVSLAGWLDGLERCAAKAGRPLKQVEVLTPEADFPSPDGQHPLKMAICSVD